MLEKICREFKNLRVVPAIVKPATITSYLTRSRGERNHRIGIF